MQKVFDGCRVTAGRSLTKHHTALIVAQCTVFYASRISEETLTFALKIASIFHMRLNPPAAY